MANIGFAFCYPGGKIVQDVDSITVVNATAKTNDITVPAGKRWLIILARLVNPDDVQRYCQIGIYKEAAKTNLLAMLCDETLAASGGDMQWPATVSDIDASRCSNGYPGLILVAGNTVNFYWASGGASTGATDADACVLWYLEIDEA